MLRSSGDDDLEHLAVERVLRSGGGLDVGWLGLQLQVERGLELKHAEQFLQFQTHPIATEQGLAAWGHVADVHGSLGSPRTSRGHAIRPWPSEPRTLLSEDCPDLPWDEAGSQGIEAPDSPLQDRTPFEDELSRHREIRAAGAVTGGAAEFA